MLPCMFELIVIIPKTIFMCNFHYTHPMMIGPNRASETASPAQKPNKILDRVFIAPLRISIDQLTQLLDLAGIGIAHLI